MTPLAKRRLLIVLVVSLAAGALLGWTLFRTRPLEQVVNSIGMRFALIPSGKFLMGSPEDEERRGDDELLHEVTLTKPFYLGIHEVTVEQYHDVMGTDADTTEPSKIKGRGECPADDVTWFKAEAFCRKLSDRPEEKSAKRRYRLPTEAEWEYACRTGKKGRAISSGGRPPPPDPKKQEPDSGPLPVGSFEPNKWGLYDMQGNVWEWCQDWYGPYSPDPADNIDPQGPKTGEQRVARGGSKLSPYEDYRSANRVALAPGIRLGMGFRVVMIEEGK